MAESEEEEVEPPTGKIAKKKYYPFGTPSHLNHPYSQFKHLNVDTKDFAISLATATDVKAEVIEEKPKRVIKRPPKASIPHGGLGSKSQSTDEADPLNDGIPIAEGMEPCTKIPCQQVLKAIMDTLYQNEVERDEIEESYQQLLLELEASQNQIANAEGKLVHLSEIGNQLEHRHNQLLGNVETLETTRSGLLSERQDINNKVMQLETERQKCNRNLEKAEKTLATAIWRKKNEEHKQNVEMGLAIGGSEISEQSIVHTDAKSVASADSTYHTSYNRLAQKDVVDVIEQPGKITTVPPYLVDRLVDYPHHFDKYATHHYNKLAKHGVESWKSMEGSLITGSVFSSSSRGCKHEHLVDSYHEYTAARAQHKLMTSVGPGSPVSNATSRVGSLLQSRTGRLGSPQSLIATIRNSQSGSLLLDTSQQLSGSINSPHLGSRRTNRRSKSQVKLAPLTQGKNSNSGGGAAGSNTQDVTAATTGVISSNSAPGSAATAAMGASGRGSSLDAMDSTGDIGNNNSSMSTLSPGGYSTQEGNTFVSEEEYYRSHLDPVFYSDKSRSLWGRKSKVGKVRTMDVGWGMLAHKKAAQGAMMKAKREKAAAEEAERQKTMTASERRRMSKLDDVQREEPTVKSRSLTMYHPKMEVFRDSFTISNSM